ncbi:MAG TPA: hypothetical protein VFC82_00910 [Actinomycetaceae bacterium]|nr:hypothetical protein [Actinomycetaceae bacterium]
MKVRHLARWKAVLAAVLLIPLLVAGALIRSPSPVEPASRLDRSAASSPQNAPGTDPAEAAVADWLHDVAPGVIVDSDGSGLSLDRLAAVTSGHPEHGTTWTRAFLAGVSGIEPVELTNFWITPLMLDSVGVGCIQLEVVDDEIEDHLTLWDRGLGHDLLANRGATYVTEGEGAVWFRLTDGVLTPVSRAARDVLAGTMLIEEYQPFLVGRLGAGENGPNEKGTEMAGSLVPVSVTAAALVGVLGLAGVVVWLRRRGGTP